jgi:mRNA-degrading endonuclease RelE of RelBE toxin-antitoxin system
LPNTRLPKWKNREVKFRLTFTTEAKEILERLAEQDRAKHKKVLKTLGLLETNPRHPGLQTHKFSLARRTERRGRLRGVRGAAHPRCLAGVLV